MTSLFALRAILFAGELLAGSSVIVALGWLAAARKTASARHLAWTAVTAALLALPLLAAILPSLVHITLPSPPPPLSLPEPMSDSELLAAASQLAAAHPTPAPSSFDFDLSRIVFALGVLWLLGVCVVALRFAASALCLVALTRRSRSFALAPEDEPRVAARGQECELRLSDRDAGPLTWGIWHPVVLLPNSALTWPRERMHAVLLHELAHIRRRDSLTLALSQAACALYWPNPFVWIAARHLRREAEIAADDWVIVAGVKPSHYAGELVALARTFKTRGPAFANLAVSMAAPSALEARVKSLLSETQARTGVTTMDVLKIAGAGFFAATALALACPSLAQETQQPTDQSSLDAVPALPAATVAARALPPIDGAAINPPATPAQVPVASTPAIAASAPRIAVAQAAPVEAASADTPDAPDAPPAPPAAPDAPPAPPMAVAAPDAPPAPPALPAPTQDTHMHAWVDGHEIDGYYHKLTPEERAQIRAEIEKARAEAHAAMEKAGPEIRRALEQARAGEEAARAARPAMEEAMREVARHRVEMDQAMASIQPKIEEALAKVRADLASQHLDAHIQARIDEALKRAEIRIQAEAAHEQWRAEHDGRNVIFRETDRANGDRTEERTETDGK